MTIFERIFGNNEQGPPPPNIRFGRYTDSYRAAAQQEAFDSAVFAFEKEDYKTAYRAFLDYLRDEKEDNIRAWEEKGTLHFEFFQGSKKVTGYANEQKFYAEAKIAKAKLPTHVEVQASQVGLLKDSVVLLEQVRTIDKTRLIQKLGHLEEGVMVAVDKALVISLGLYEEDA